MVRIAQGNTIHIANAPPRVIAALRAALIGEAAEEGAEAADGGDNHLRRRKGGIAVLHQQNSSDFFFALEQATIQVTENWMIILGAILIPVVIFFPRGILGTILHRLTSHRGKKP